MSNFIVPVWYFFLAWRVGELAEEKAGNTTVKN